MFNNKDIADQAFYLVLDVSSTKDRFKLAKDYMKAKAFGHLKIEDIDDEKLNLNTQKFINEYYLSRSVRNDYM